MRGRPPGQLYQASADLRARLGGEGPGPLSERLLAAHYVCMQYATKLTWH